jgi:hypothetical protein
MYVGGLWRYPVKSLQGERLAAATLTSDGVEGDRIVHVRGPRGPLTGRTRRDLLTISAFTGDDGVPRVQSHSHSVEIRKLGTFMSKPIEDALHNLATGRDASWHVVRAAAEALLTRDSDRGVRTVYAIARQRPAARPTGSLFAARWKQAAHAVAALVASSALPVEFDRLMKLFEKAPDLAEDVVAVTGDRIGDNSSWSALSSDQLATLYVWARRALPQAPEYAPGAILNVNPVHDFP